MVVRAVNVRRLIPASPISDMILATVFSDTRSPAARRSAAIRGDPSRLSRDDGR
jgi:hypothetical protein